MYAVAIFHLYQISKPTYQHLTIEDGNRLKYTNPLLGWPSSSYNPCWCDSDVDSPAILVLYRGRSDGFRDGDEQPNVFRR